MPMESAIKWVILSKRAWPAESSASVPRKRFSSLRLLVPVVSSMGGIYGAQFHPESIATAHGHKLLGNFLKTAGLNVAADITPQHLTLTETLEA